MKVGRLLNRKVSETNLGQYEDQRALRVGHNGYIPSIGLPPLAKLDGHYKLVETSVIKPNGLKVHILKPTDLDTEEYLLVTDTSHAIWRRISGPARLIEYSAGAGPLPELAMVVSRGFSMRVVESNGKAYVAKLSDDGWVIQDDSSELIQNARLDLCPPELDV